MNKEKDNILYKTIISQVEYFQNPINVTLPKEVQYNYQDIKN